jgi:hypothetical protein
MQQGRMGNFISNAIEKIAGAEGIDFFFFLKMPNYFVITTTGMSPVLLPEEIFIFFLFLLPIFCFKKG